MGRFLTPVVTQWSRSDHHHMIVVNEVRYVDSKGRLWVVPPGTMVDGKSVPLVLRLLFGSPFVGPSREASVLHDYGCIQNVEMVADGQPVTDKDVHWVFWDAARAHGTNRIKAFLMWLGLKWFGPAWEYES